MAKSKEEMLEMFNQARPARPMPAGAPATKQPGWRAKRPLTAGGAPIVAPASGTPRSPIAQRKAEQDFAESEKSLGGRVLDYKGVLGGPSIRELPDYGGVLDWPSARELAAGAGNLLTGPRAEAQPVAPEPISGQRPPTTTVGDAGSIPYVAQPERDPNFPARPAVGPPKPQVASPAETPGQEPPTGWHPLPHRRSGEAAGMEYVWPHRQAGGEEYRQKRSPQQQPDTGLLPQGGTQEVATEGMPDTYTDYDAASLSPRAEPFTGPTRPSKAGFDAATMADVASYRAGLGPGAQTEFGEADKARYSMGSGSFAGSTGGGGTVSTIPAFDPKLAQTQAQNAVMRKWLSMDPSERGPAPGSPAEARQIARSYAPSAPEVTSPWERRTALRNAAVGEPSDWDRRHMTDSQYKTAMGAHQAGIDRVADRFAAEDKQQTLRDVAQTRAGAQGGSGFAEQLGLARLGLDTAKARETQQQNIFERGQAKAKAGREQTDAFNEQLGQAVDRYGLPSWGEDLLRELGGAPMEMGARIQRILEEDPNLKAAIEARGSWLASDETDAETRESAMATLRQRLTGEA